MQKEEFSHEHRCPFWLFCQKNRWPWFTWWFNHLPGPSISLKRTPMVMRRGVGRGVFRTKPPWLALGTKFGPGEHVFLRCAGSEVAKSYLTFAEMNMHVLFSPIGVKGNRCYYWTFFWELIKWRFWTTSSQCMSVIQAQLMKTGTDQDDRDRLVLTALDVEL